MQNHIYTNIYSSPLMVSSHSACGLSWGRRWGEQEKRGRRWHNLPNTTSHSGTGKLVSVSLGSQPRSKVLPECRVSVSPSIHFWMLSAVNLVPTKLHPHRRPKDRGQSCLPPAQGSLRHLPNRPRSTRLSRSLSDSPSPPSLTTIMIHAHARGWAQCW